MVFKRFDKTAIDAAKLQPWLQQRGYRVTRTAPTSKTYEHIDEVDWLLVGEPGKEILLHVLVFDTTLHAAGSAGRYVNDQKVENPGRPFAQLNYGRTLFVAFARGTASDLEEFMDVLWSIRDER